MMFVLMFVKKSGRFISCGLAYLLMASSLCLAQELQSLLIPFGSYLEKAKLNRLYVKDNQLHYNDFYYNDFSMLAAIQPIPLECWKKQNDIALNNGHLYCNTSITYPEPINTADFSFTELIPTGDYTERCGFMLKTKENTDEGLKSFLYATCHDYEMPIIDNTPANFKNIWKSHTHAIKSDITNCPPGGLHYAKGELKCTSDNSIAKHKIVYGSFLKSACDIGYTFYESDSDRLATVCNDKALELNGVSECIADGKDIVFDFKDDKLQCKPGKLVAEIHTSSDFLPAGNYLITCVNSAYYPCLGENHQGLLVTQCMTNGWFISMKTLTLENADEKCKMGGAGYISNLNSTLKCDPLFNLNIEYPTQATDVAESFECKQ